MGTILSTLCNLREGFLLLEFELHFLQLFELIFLIKMSKSEHFLILVYEILRTILINVLVVRLDIITASEFRAIELSFHN